MFLEIYKLIEKYENIAIARHVGADPDAMGACFALKNSILLTFPNKKVSMLGAGTSRFAYFGKLERVENILENTLLIVCDTPDVKRIDGIDDLSKFSDIIKIDHHPFIDKFSENSLEYIDVEASSASQIVLELINGTDLLMDEEIAKQLFWGIISDTNRFMFNNSTPKTFYLIGDLIQKFQLDMTKLYEPLYLRPIEEVRLEGFIANNFQITDNGVGYMKITNSLLEEYQVDAAAPGNMIGNFNYIDGVYIWLFITEDIKNGNFRVSIRYRGPIINSIAEKYNGGGHKYASGAKLYNLLDADKLINDLNDLCGKYLKSIEGDQNEN